MDIPTSLYEAAQVDGASKIQQFFAITLPCLKPITYLVVTLGIIWSFQSFDIVYAMTKGWPRASLRIHLFIPFTMLHSVSTAWAMHVQSQ